MSRIGILNFPGHNNHGANLTAYALQKLLRDWGHHAVNLHLLCNYAQKKNPLYTEFSDRHIEITPYAAEGINNMYRYNGDFDTFIVGSDQVWRAPDEKIFYWKHPFDPCFRLAFAAPDKRRISVAASFGHGEYHTNQQDEALFGQELKRFTAISVRERSGVPIVERLCGQTPQLLIDPVFYLPQEEWHALALPEEDNAHVGCIAYNSFFHKESIRTLQDSLPEGTELYNLLSGDTKQWLAGIRDARFVITDSFHVTCFCLMFHTPFMCLTNAEQGATRFYELADTFAFSPERVVIAEETDDIAAAVTRIMNLPLDTASIDHAIEHGRETAHRWLKKALEAPVPPWSGEPYRVPGLKERLQEKRCSVQYRRQLRHRLRATLFRLALLFLPYKRDRLRYKLQRERGILAGIPW